MAWLSTTSAVGILIYMNDRIRTVPGPRGVGGGKEGVGRRGWVGGVGKLKYLI